MTDPNDERDKDISVDAARGELRDALNELRRVVDRLERIVEEREVTSG